MKEAIQVSIVQKLIKQEVELGRNVVSMEADNVAVL
jgi:hypothetical protein